MTPERWRQVEAVVQAALERGESERGLFLDEACGDDDALRREVDTLIASHDSADEFLESSPFESLDALAGRPLPAGERIGPYRILHEIGRGGMGTVYMAVRDDDEYESRVAIKLLHPTPFHEDLVRRFRGERQILASLHHPNIARLYDGGTTPDGRPYLVMEPIDGMPITRYCENHRLTVRQRLELFRQVLGAVQYAHQSLVVHRDIKPGNILVTTDGDPKLLDFGIAKLLDPTAFALTMEATVTGLLPMTPHYASPEQILGQPITTAADVYSLGVLLYRLLTGHLPHHFAGLLPPEVGRVLTEEPEAPSAAVDRDDDETADDDDETADDDAPLHPLKGTRRQLVGDLDNIVLMALRKEPRRRYASAEQLSEDVRRHLEGLPVLARPDTLGYRLSKFLGRHRLAAAVAATVSALVVAFALAMALQVAETRRQRDRAELERDKAEQVATFLVDLFELVDPEKGRGSTITAREVLDQGAQRLGRELEGQPLVRATLLGTIGKVYTKLGLYDEARPLLDDALAQRRALLGEEHLDVAASLDDLGLLCLETNEHERAGELFRGALEIREKTLPPEAQDFAASFLYLGDVHLVQGDYDAAESRLEQALAILEAAGQSDLETLGTTLHDLGGVYRFRGESQRALATLQRSFEVLRRALGPEHPKVATNLHTLASVYVDQGRLQEARPLFEQAREIYTATLGAEHNYVATTLQKLGAIYQGLGDYRRAEEALERVRDAYEDSFPAGHFAIGVAHHNLGYLHYVQGDFKRAEPLFQRAVETVEQALGADHIFVATSLHYLAQIRRHGGDLDGAEQLLLRVLEIRQPVLGADHHHLALTFQALAEAALAGGRHDTAREYYERALAIREKRADDHPDSPQEQGRLAAAYLGLGDLHHALGDSGRSRELMARAADIMEPLTPGSDVVELLGTHAVALLRLGRVDEAQPLAGKLLAAGWGQPDFLELARRHGLTASPGSP